MSIVAIEVAKFNLVPLLTFSTDFSKDKNSLDIFSSCYLRTEKYQHFRIFSAFILVTLLRSLTENTNYLNEAKKKKRGNTRRKRETT